MIEAKQVILIVSNDTIMKPPYTITPRILSLITAISEKVGAINAVHLQHPKAELRKANRIKTIQSSLEIEGNTLSMDQVTALLENKKVLAPEKDITEVKNAIAVYNLLEELEATSISSFLIAHKLLMKGLISSAGRFRTGGVGIIKGSQLTHLAPPAKMVRSLLNNLFTYLKKDKDPLLIKSCVFHYEMEFIHPFSDGNGRMGRLWQTVILKKYNPLFSFLPVETVIKKRQSDYYSALSKADKAGNSTPFIEFMLEALDEALKEQLHERQSPLSANNRILIFKNLIGKTPFTRKDYMDYFKTISPATASRDLKMAVDSMILKITGEKRTAKYIYSR